MGKERTTQIVETYAAGGKLPAETKASLLQLVALAERPDPEVLLARVRHRKSRTDSRLSSASIIRHRDADRH